MASTSREERDANARRKYSQRKRGRNKPPKDEPWVWETQGLLTSDAWQCLSVNARKVVDRVLVEHMAHAGFENGNLMVTHEDFVRYGVTRRLVTQSIDEAEFLGLLKAKRGGKSTSSGTWMECLHPTCEPSTLGFSSTG